MRLGTGIYLGEIALVAQQDAVARIGTVATFRTPDLPLYRTHAHLLRVVVPPGGLEPGVHRRAPSERVAADLSVTWKVYFLVTALLILLLKKGFEQAQFAFQKFSKLRIRYSSAAAQLTVDGQVEQREVAQMSGWL